MDTGVAAGNTFNLTWHDWLNMRSLSTFHASSRMPAGRENSRGAHYQDFPMSATWRILFHPSPDLPLWR